jgi:acetylornithine/succinyldiaminopimelate/putrescine aminotransferase
VLKSLEGEGLLLSLELATEEKARAFNKSLAKAGVIAVPGKIARNTVVLRPALTISRKDVSYIVVRVVLADSSMGKSATAKPARSVKGKK